MADGGDTLIIRTIESLSEASAAQWNSLIRPYNPFVSHEFLSALEESGSVGGRSGWTPAHLLLESGGNLLAAAPMYVKANSLGEYVFDHHWADALHRAGGRYYPKLLCAPPFSPVPGPRLLAARAEHRTALTLAMIGAAREIGASSAHLNFLTAEDEATLLDAGFLSRRGVQYHWFNRGYRTYDDFLTAFASRKRKQMKRERREAQEGLNIRRLTAGEITPRHWDAFWEFYRDTGSRKWGRPYLTRAFFDHIGATLRERVMMVAAECEGRLIAGALNIIGDDALYGRYWGCTEQRPFLHFEVCYHQAIEFAIERSLARVEAGAQGKHKIARGYEPVETRSAHWIADPGFRKAIERYLDSERMQVAAEVGALLLETPYRKGAA